MRIAAAALMLCVAIAWAQAPGKLVDPMRGPVPIPAPTQPPRLSN